MAISITLKEYLDEKGVDYEVLKHPYTYSSMDTAASAHVPGSKLAKSVVLEDSKGFLMAIVPTTHHVEIDQLSYQLNRPLELATEHELSELFTDCDVGAIPPIGEAYGMDMLVDESLTQSSDVYFEAGDHTCLVHVSGDDFKELMRNAEIGAISRHT